ncbi:hypothetical protein D6764_05875 [Candidatus Woesearchaeota archaeon]|nr:MAG: hypothetical protein D6764_05875 [Candidatus Woesearchaeota archaeon]
MEPYSVLLTDFGRNFEQATVEQASRTYRNLGYILANADRTRYGALRNIHEMPEPKRIREGSFDRRDAAVSLEGEIEKIAGKYDYAVLAAVVDPTTGQRYDGKLHRNALLSEKNAGGTKVYVVAPDNGIHEAIDPDRVYAVEQDILNWLALGDKAIGENDRVIAGPPVWQGGFTYGPALAALLLTGNPYFIAHDYDGSPQSFDEHDRSVISPARESSLVSDLSETLYAFRDELRYLEAKEFPFENGSVDHNGNRTFNLRWPLLDDSHRIAGVSLWANRKGEEVPVAYLPLTGSYLPDVSSPKPSRFGVLSSWGYSDGSVPVLGTPWLEAFVYEGKFDEHLKKTLKRNSLELEDLKRIRIHYFPDEHQDKPAFLKSYKERKEQGWSGRMLNKFLTSLEEKGLL